MNAQRGTSKEGRRRKDLALAHSLCPSSSTLRVSAPPTLPHHRPFRPPIHLRLFLLPLLLPRSSSLTQSPPSPFASGSTSKISTIVIRFIIQKPPPQLLYRIDHLLSPFRRCTRPPHPHHCPRRRHRWYLQLPRSCLFRSKLLQVFRKRCRLQTNKGTQWDHLFSFLGTEKGMELPAGRSCTILVSSLPISPDSGPLCAIKENTGALGRPFIDHPSRVVLFLRFFAGSFEQSLMKHDQPNYIYYNCFFV